MRKPFASLYVPLLALFLLTTAVSAFAQSNKGSIVGTVRDLNEALVANAKIKVTSVKTGEVRETDTNDEGTFTVTNLEPGQYNVTVEAPGFQPVTFQALQVETKFEIKQQDKFRFVEEGTGDPLLLLHGLFGALSNFYGLIDYFRNYNKVIVPSLPLFELDILHSTV